MKILVVGGPGMIGATAALHLREQGNEVTISGRTPVKDDSPVASFPMLLGDYMAQTFTADMLTGFDAVLFAAGQDVRHKPGDVDEDAYWQQAQSAGVPGFAALAKQAGVARFVQVGSYYHQVWPELADTNAYVAARKAADDGVRALADESFNASTLNPPSIIGAIAGLSAKRYRRMVSWAAGNEPQFPDFAPSGGTNYMSVRSLSEAIWGALQRAESGRAYLIGDENLSYRQFFQLLVDAAGGNRVIEERDEDHPFMPDAIIVHGRGNVLAYEPDAAEVELLGYTRHDCERAVRDLVDVVRRSTGG
jgi:nucleoside-diphosphate-sugar epimerase